MLLLTPFAAWTLPREGVFGIFYSMGFQPAVSAYVLCFFLKKLSKPTSLFGSVRLLGALKFLVCYVFLASVFSFWGSLKK